MCMVPKGKLSKGVWDERSEQKVCVSAEVGMLSKYLPTTVDETLKAFVPEPFQCLYWFSTF